MDGYEQAEFMNVSNQVYAPVFKKLDQFVKSDGAVIIGIDGSAASGKSELVKLLLGKYSCRIFHMDDYFLPEKMKTVDRLAEPGGNIHYERFLTEVMEPLSRGEKVNYQPFDCQKNDYLDLTEIEPAKINIIEGVYSFHPTLTPYYDWKILLKTNPVVQLERLKEREGKAKLKRFVEEWIPLENAYYERLAIEEQVDQVVDTSALTR